MVIQVFLALFCVIQLSMAQQQVCTSCLPSDIYVTVQYQVTFPFPASCPIAKGATPPPSYSLTIAVPSGSTVLDVMQQAVGIDGKTPSAFKFSATNFGPQLGFSIDTIGGTSSISNGTSGCYWQLLYSYQNNPFTSSNVGASHFSICCNEYSIVWQYTKY